MTDATPRARDDTAAIAAYGAGFQLDAVAAAADWRFLVEADREHWRGVADGAPDETLAEHMPVRFPARTAAAAKQLAAAEGMTVSAWIRREVEREVGRREKQPAPEAQARPAWLVTDFDGYWEAQGYQRTGVEFDREDLSDAFDAGAQAARYLAATAPARLEAADRAIREVLESLCRRDGLPLESAVVPGEPARNYELADRLGIGHVFGLQPQSAAPAGPKPAPVRDYAAQFAYPEWRGWLDAQGYHFDDDSYQAQAFTAGMQAARLREAPGGTP